MKRGKNIHRFAAPIAALAVIAMLSGCGPDKMGEDVEHALAYRQIGINAMESGDYATAIESFQRALDQSKGQVRNLELDICMNKAEALYRNGQTEEAIGVCNAVIDYDKDYADAYYLRGNLYLRQGDSKRALADYEAAAEYAGSDYGMYIQLYENLSMEGMQDEAQGYLSRALEIEGKDRYHLTNRGYIYYLMGDYAQAAELLGQAVALEQEDGSDDKALLYLAQATERLGDKEGAAGYYEEYAEDHEDDPVVLGELGGMAMEKGDYAAALAYYQRGLEADKPANEQALRQGEIAALEQMFEFEQAKEKMAQYVLDYPDDEHAAREYLFLKTRTAAADQAKKERKAAKAAEGDDGAD